MPSVTYKPADVLQWFGVGARTAKHRARKKGQAALQGSDFAKGLREAAVAAAEYGKGAWNDLVQRQAEETTVVLDDDGFEVWGLGGKRRAAYSDVALIKAKTHDRYEVKLRTGSFTLKPIAHLVSGRLRVPVGWLRNGMEVPYATLVEELAARCQVEIVHE